MQVLELFQKQKPNIINSLKEWQCWQESALGNVLMEQEQKVLASELQKVTGKELLQVSISKGFPLYDMSPIANKTLVSFDSPVHGLGNAVVSSPEYLPISNESIDVLILHHVLEFSDNRHQILRESQRIIASGGRLFIVGFNPWSLWALRKTLTYKKCTPWNGRYLSKHRVCDWLNLLDFKILNVQFAQFGWPFNNARHNKKCNLLNVIGNKYNCSFGWFYVLSARKQVSGMTLISSQRTRNNAMTFPITEPSIRSVKSNDKNH